MKIQNVRDFALEIGAINKLVNPGETVEVDALLGKSLCEQESNWKSVSSGSKKSQTADDGDKQEA